VLQEYQVETASADTTIDAVYSATRKQAHDRYVELKKSGRHVLWVACSKWADTERIDLSRWHAAVLFQDVPLPQLQSIVDSVVNRIIVPLCLQHKAIFFYSQSPRSAYEVEISSNNLHTNFSELYSALRLEQLVWILDHRTMPRTNMLAAGEPIYPQDMDLDHSQSQAIRHVYGPVRVLAPAGSGKTKTLINRIIHLLNHGVPAGQILALAFNKKAAEEMAERLSKRGIPVARRFDDVGVTMRTFHGLGYEIIRQQLGWRYQGDDGDQRCRELLRRAAVDVLKLPALRNEDPVSGLMASLSQVKTDLLADDEMRTEVAGEILPFSQVFHRYLALQQQAHYINFDDMIYWAIRLLLDRTALRQRLQQRFQFLLVDEFQDLNRSQLLLMKMLGWPHANVYVVGDDDQMIYGWRGAHIDHILHFADTYGGAQTFTLQTNYRSSREIIRHSTWLIRNNKKRVAKEIKPGGAAKSGAFSVHLDETLWGQARQVCRWLQQLNKNGVAWNRMAVLYRFHAFQYILAVLLDQYKIPHSPVSGKSLLQTPVGRDLFSYLTVLFFPDQGSGKDFERALKRPNKFLTNPLIRSITSWDDFMLVLESENVPERERVILDHWLQNCRFVQNVARQPRPVAQILHALVSVFDLHEFYQQRHNVYGALDDGGNDVLLQVLLEVSSGYESLSAFYNDLSKANLEPDNTGNGAAAVDEGVVLSTIHASKGKEFQHVAYFNLAETEFANSQGEEEERRVAYVGLTRAIDSLLVTAPQDKYSDFLLEASMNPEWLRFSLPELMKKNRQARQKLAAGESASRKKHAFLAAGKNDPQELERIVQETDQEIEMRRLFWGTKARGNDHD
jgi:DNA helicase-2/ATP-dependent DNA helicase PcrA